MNGKRTLITGGTGGLGGAVTMAALQRGAITTVSYTAEDGRKALADRLPGGADVTFISLDVTDEAAVASALAALGDVAILIHLVGNFSPMGKTAEYALTDYERQIALNLTSTFIMCKHALGAMQRTGYGRIVTVSSRTAVEGGASSSAYAAAKAGVIALTRAIADETRGTDITANCVLPSVIDTPANREAMPKADPSKWVTPASLAEVICFLAGEEGGRLRGAAVPVYGDA